MAEHTAGPWNANPHVSDGRRSQTIVFDAGKHGIALIYQLADPEAQFANARLIAAAPELLAALETLLAEHIGYAGDGSEDHECCVCKMARAAIRKARGV